MGDEELEDSEFEPMYSSIKPKLNGKKSSIIRILWMGRM